MKKQEKNKGITLISLVITIIILLILAGVSIAQLGSSGLFEKTLEARAESIHSSVKEGMILKHTEYTLEQNIKSDFTKTFIEYLQEAEIIGDEIGEGSWQINTQKLLGSKTSIGKGTATESSKEDVYMLEIDDTSETAILQKVATTNPLKIAETSTNSNTKYKVVYYGKTEDENRNLWDFELSNSDSEKMVTVIVRL